MQNADRDTIVALGTASGEGAIGIVRLSGSQAIEIADACFQGRQTLSILPSRYLTYGCFVFGGQNLDEVLATVMRAPHSYTGEDIVEFNCHGGPFLLRMVIGSLVKSGARLALPGEFTKRAFLNGKLDLSQAEAVSDMISARSELGLQSAYFQLRGGLKKRFESMAENLRRSMMLLEVGLDFSEDVVINFNEINGPTKHALSEIETLIATYSQGKIMREGVLVTLAGCPNVGKSSLLNRLLEEDRAIVTNIPGTTRDTIEEEIDLDGLSVTLVDTAGIRQTDDPIEQEGTRRSRQYVDRAGLVLFIVDGSQPPTDDDLLLLSVESQKQGFLVLNKIDLHLHPSWKCVNCSMQRLHISAITGQGIPELKQTMRSTLLGKGERSTEIVTRERHVIALREAKEGLTQALTSLHLGNPGELIAMDLRVALDALSEIIGETTSDDVLDCIFKSFCIGK